MTNKRGRPPLKNPSRKTLEQRLYRKRKAAERCSREKKTLSQLPLAQRPPPPHAPSRLVVGTTSEDWLAKDAPWSLISARSIASKRICWRYLQTGFTPMGSGSPRISLRTCGIQVLALNDNNRWRKWLEIRPSKAKLVTEEGGRTGVGVFAGRSFSAGDVITQFCGEVTTCASKRKRWLATWRKDYAIMKQDGCTLICPASRGLKDLLFGAHFINHSDTPNCEIGPDMVVRAICDVRSKQELTIDYNRDQIIPKKDV